MLKGKTILKSAALASLMALPMAANALTIGGDDTLTNTSFTLFDSDGTSTAISPAAAAGDLSLGVLQEYLIQFIASDTGSFFEVTQGFTNDSGEDFVFSASGRNIDSDFDGFTLEAIVGATTYNLDIDGALFAVGAGEQFTIRASGDVTSPGNFDLTIAAIPLPAAGLMLLTALGGLGIARRRKKA